MKSCFLILMCVSSSISKFKHLFSFLPMLFVFVNYICMFFIGMFLNIWLICGRSLHTRDVNVCLSYVLIIIISLLYLTLIRVWKNLSQVYESFLFQLWPLCGVWAVKRPFHIKISKNPYIPLLLLEFSCLNIYKLSRISCDIKCGIEFLLVTYVSDLFPLI